MEIMLCRRKAGFTLIELSIVLVVIGLIVGGILVGRDLISAAAVRAQISQIEKYQTAANTFRGKYGYLPGDIPDPDATQFGFISRGTSYPAGKGDGNGVLAGVWGDCVNCDSSNPFYQGIGETAVFWVDLSQAHLIDGGFNTATSTRYKGSGLINPAISGAALDELFPQAKIAQGAYVLVWSGVQDGFFGPYAGTMTGSNYFAINGIRQLSSSAGMSSLSGRFLITVRQAQSIDAKVDDGLPQQGRVMANYASNIAYWAGSGAGFDTPTTIALAGSASTCFDNSTDPSGSPGVANGAVHYSLEISNGSYTACAVSFKFQ